jgi:opacity protein-like surface antigen
MKRISIGVAVLALTLAAPVYAGNAGHAYGGIDYSFGSFSGPGVSANPGNFGLRGGYYFTDNIAAEVHVLTGGTTDKGIKVDQVVAGFVRGELPATEGLAIYGLLGYASADVTGAATKSNSGFSYGAGVEYAVSNQVGINLDYIQYFNANSQTLTSLSAGVKYNF